MTRQPFVGWSGKELWTMLGEAMPDQGQELHRAARRAFKYDNAWIRHREPWLAEVSISFTNVLNLRPLANRIGELCCRKAELPAGYNMPALGTQGKNLPNGPFLRSEYLPELERLMQEIWESQPNLIVAMGNTACWALLHATNIGSIRGAVAEARGQRGEALVRKKVLPTYHPAAVLRQWSWRPIVVADLIKAAREAQFPEIIRPQRRVLINPTLVELIKWTGEILASRPKLMAVDIETGAGQIKCIGFGVSRSEAIVIPFVDLAHPSGSYWPQSTDELKAWGLVKELMESQIPKLFQNGAYDLQYIAKMGIRPVNCLEDTMLMHHSLFPEMLKGLGFLGSIYTNESSWKLMNRPKADTEKRDE